MPTDHPFGILPLATPFQTRFHQSRRELVFTFFSGDSCPYHLLLPDRTAADIAAAPKTKL